MPSPTAYKTLKLAGAFYVIWLGIGLLRPNGEVIGKDAEEAWASPSDAGC